MTKTSTRLLRMFVAIEKYSSMLRTFDPGPQLKNIPWWRENILRGGQTYDWQGMGI